MSKADPSLLTIPVALPPNIRQWSSNHVQTFLKANQEEYDLSDEHISAIRKEQVNGRALLRQNEGSLRRYGIPDGPVLCIMDLITEVKRNKGILKPGK